MRKISYCLLSAAVALMLFCVEVRSQSIDDLRRYDTTFVVKGVYMSGLYRLSMDWFVEEFYREGCQVTLMNPTLGRLRGDHCLGFQSAESHLHRVAYSVAIDVTHEKVRLVLSEPVYIESDNWKYLPENAKYKPLTDRRKLLQVRKQWAAWAAYLDFRLTGNDRRPK